MKMNRFLTLLALSCSTLGYTSQTADQLLECPVKSVKSELDALVNGFWDFYLQSNPELGTYYGYSQYNNQTKEYTLEAFAAQTARFNDFLKALSKIDRATLDADAQIDYDLLKWELESRIILDRFPNYFLAISQMEGLHQDVPGFLKDVMPRETDQDFENVLSRLQAFPRSIEQHIHLLQMGLEKGVTYPQVTLKEVPNQVLNFIKDAPEESLFMQLFADASEDIKARALQIISEKVYPAYKRFAAYLQDQYVPHARTTTGMKDLPNGREWYAAVARNHIAIDLTPEEIHAMGLKEVNHVEKKIKALINHLGFEDSYEKFQEHLKSAPEFYYSEASELVAGHQAILDKVTELLPKYFISLPKGPLQVITVPKETEQCHAAAYYLPGSQTRAGRFYVNTYALNSRPKWEMTALALHEGVPGHHLQQMLAREQITDSPLKKTAGCTSFIEGWALYSEFLGEEMGMYEDPYSLFGRYSMEMLRAVRLVVDTGLHAFGWTPEQAQDFFRKHAWMIPEHEMQVEVNRYLVLPGQALAYKVGELKIHEWRALATEKLGEKFDLREFHEQLMLKGCLPLQAMEEHMHAWIKAKQ